MPVFAAGWTDVAALHSCFREGVEQVEQCLGVLACLDETTHRQGVYITLCSFNIAYSNIIQPIPEVLVHAARSQNAG